MKLDRPDVLLSNVAEIAALYSSSSVLRARLLPGIPNVSVAVTLVDRTELVVRVCNNGYTSIEHLQAEVDALLFLADRGFQYSPRLVLGQDGTVVQRWSNYRTICTERIIGLPGSPGQRLSARQGFDLGRVVGILMRNLRSWNVRFPRSEGVFDRFTRIFGAAPTQQTLVKWGMDSVMIFEACTEAFSRVSSGDESQVLHSDIWPPNVIWNGGSVSGIVDFDDMAEGPPVLDLAAPLSEFCMTDEGELLPSARNLLGGFSSSHDLDGAPHLMADAIVVLCATWLCCNAFHSVDHGESVGYLNRLQAMSGQAARTYIGREIQSMLS